MSGDACDATARLSSTEPWEFALLNSSQLLTCGSLVCCTFANWLCNCAALFGAYSSSTSEYCASPRNWSCDIFGLSAAPTRMSLNCFATCGLLCPPPPPAPPPTALVTLFPGATRACPLPPPPDPCGATCPKKFIAKYHACRLVVRSSDLSFETISSAS